MLSAQYLSFINNSKDYISLYFDYIIIYILLL